MQPIHAPRNPSSHTRLRAARAPCLLARGGTVLSCLVAMILLPFTINGAAATAPPVSAKGEAAKAPTGRRLADLLRATQKAQERRDFRGAIANATAALAMHPDRRNEALLYQLRAFANLQLENYAHTIADDEAAFRADPTVRGAHRDRAYAYLRLEQFSKAVTEATAAINEGTNFPTNSFAVRAKAHARLGKQDAARYDLLRITQLPMRNAMDRSDRAYALEHLHEYKAALADYAAVKRDPLFAPSALNSTAWLEATCPDSAVRNGAAAVRDARRACELNKWQKPDYVDTLAAAYAEAGDFAQAVRYETDAVKAAPARWHGDAERRVREAEQRLQLFRASQPYHAAPEF